jgi:hypothetical protein
MRDAFRTKQFVLKLLAINEKRRQDAGATNPHKRAMLALAAADEVDDFVAIASHDQRLAPFLARENFQVALDRNAAIVQTKLAQEIDYIAAGNRRPRFAIYLNRRFHFATSSRLDSTLSTRQSVLAANDSAA